MFGLLVFAAAVQAAPVNVAPVAPAVDWRLAPTATGSWSWRAIPGGSEALFQDYRGAQLAIRCTLATRTVAIARTGAINGAPLLLRTTSAERSLAAGGRLFAMDSLLDAIAFSRGRFAVEVAGAPRLIVPAWPEAARAVEDCRK